MVLGSGVTTIGASAFESCTNLRSITIPSSVTHIGGYTFYGNANLSAMYFRGEPPTRGTEVFGLAPQVVAYYLLGSTG